MGERTASKSVNAAEWHRYGYENMSKRIADDPLVDTAKITPGLRPALKKYATTVRESITAWAWMMR
jgi:hypothetical protein